MGLEQGPWQYSKKTRKKERKTTAKNLRECGLMPKMETHTLMFLCVYACVYVCVCVCVFVLVAVRVCCHAYACMGTHMDARRNVV